MTPTGPQIRRESESPDDAALLERLRAGDLQALDDLFHRHATSLLGVAYRLTGSSADAEDIVQDVFVGLPLALRRYAEQGSFAGWLRTVTVRLALDRMRRRERRREVALDPVIERTAGGAGDAGAMEARWELEQALAALPDTLRVVLLLKEVEGYSHAEIGRMLGIRTGTSEVRLHRAIRTLRRVLGDQ
ncbi:MAG TPA: RNA polymerase sigma factor [Gemmatimonadales bacterium]|nr:RNA polymerase sigma factor [Gemmatimonadales bacterium]